VSSQCFFVLAGDESLISRMDIPQCRKPNLVHEERLWAAGRRHVAGVDEAGRGALAGPVVAASVVVSPHTTLSGVWAEVCDSKLLPPGWRAILAEQIQAAALAWGIGSTSPMRIDEIGIAAATRCAMQQAIARLEPSPDFLLIDWVKLPSLNIAQESFAKADRDVVVVAAASILAKVHRDRFMAGLHDIYPVYGFQAHKGYGTAAHQRALSEHGPCPEHRHSFAPIARPLTLFELNRAAA
jgi:ribonuclease HII